jgi:hypothetical protein
MRRSHARQRRMEPLWSPAVAIGGNRWQMGRPAKSLRQAKTVAVGCDRLPPKLHGKEGVGGSSPPERFAESPANGDVVLPAMARLGLLAGTGRVHFGTGGHSGARATPRDTSVTYSIAATHSTSPCKQTARVSCAGTKRIPSFAREGVTGDHSARSTSCGRRTATSSGVWPRRRADSSPSEAPVRSSTPDLPVELAPRLDLAGADEFSVVCQSPPRTDP